MCAHVFTTSVEVNSTSETVWGVLSAVEKWPEWTPTMSSVQAVTTSELSVGARFTVEQPGLRPSVYEVTEVREYVSFTWQSTVAGVTTVASHQLNSLTDGGTILTLGIEMSGVLSPLVWLLAKKKIRTFVITEAQSLQAVFS